VDPVAGIPGGCVVALYGTDGPGLHNATHHALDDTHVQTLADLGALGGAADDPRNAVGHTAAAGYVLDDLQVAGKGAGLGAVAGFPGVGNIHMLLVLGVVLLAAGVVGGDVHGGVIHNGFVHIGVAVTGHCIQGPQIKKIYIIFSI